MPIHWDDLYVPRALDRLEGLNRAYYDNGEDLMAAVAQEMSITEPLREGRRRFLAWRVAAGRIVERKAKFISQVTRGRLDVRQIDDIGESTLSYTEVKALASGDPLLGEQATAASELTKLRRQQRGWERNRQLLHETIASAAAREHARRTETEQVDAAVKLRTDTRGDNFAMAVGAITYTDRPAAAAALARWAQDATLN